MSKSICDKCVYKTFCNLGIETIITGCSRFKLKKPLTNADRIRAMSDEELAEWMAINTDCFYCKIKNKNICSLDEGTCTEEWRFWLKSPVEQDVDNG